MKCYVKNCNNDGKRTVQNDSLTYHAIPIDPKLRGKWLKFLGRDNMRGLDKVFVCSQHFTCDDFEESLSGKQVIKKNAVPTVSMVQACRVCLAMDTKMYQMTEHNLMQMYEQITGLTLQDDRLPQQTCWECTHRLISCSRFRNKAIRSHFLMMDTLQTNYCLKRKNIESINRIEKGLASNLIVKTFEANHNNLHLHDATPFSSVELSSNEQTDIQIKPDWLHESIDPTQEISIDVNLIKNESDDTDGCTENDIVYDFEADSSTSSDEILAKHSKKTKKVKLQCNNGNHKVKKEAGEKSKIDKRKKPASEVLDEAFFTITDLSYEEQIAEIQKRKETSNYKNSFYKCTACFKGFLDQDVYNSHITRHTDQCGPYECDICKIRFKKSHALRTHAASHVQKFTCKCCPFVTTRRHGAKLHQEMHYGIRYECPRCLEVFIKKSTYLGHLRIKHPSDIVCALCGYSFVSDKGLRLHRRLKHRFNEQEVPPDGPYCELCDVRFISAEAHERHLKLSPKHNTDSKLNGRKRGRKPHEVPDKTDKNEKTKEHGSYKRNSCKPEGPISCEQCEMQLPDSLSYFHHFRRSHPDKNRTKYPSMKSQSMCEVCGKMFQSLALLEDHSFTHTDSKQFKCTQCDKTFQRKYRLIAHRRLHRGPRASYACAVCGKGFSTASNRQRHMFSHTGLKPFKCEMCGKCFKHASEKRAHITYVHLKKPWPKRARCKRHPDNRQGQVIVQPTPRAPEVDIVQPLWPSCNDPKIGDMLLQDKSMYSQLH